MSTGSSNKDIVTTTAYKVVLPFYMYAALAFLIAALILFTSSYAFTQHYFQPEILAITHMMALGWGTMIIFGSSYQLLPILIERQLYSNTLAYLTFAFAAVGIPMLVWSFYEFNMQWPAQYGALIINLAILSYLVNVAASIVKSRHENIHAIFVLTAGIWLFITTLIGGLLVYNFTNDLLPKDSLHYLSLHAHLGMVGWFLLVVIGVGSRLIPMFLISKYSNCRILWWVFCLINSGLLAFVVVFLFSALTFLYLLPVTLILIALSLFGYYCKKSYQFRIRKQVDGQMKISLLSVCLLIVPLVLLIVIIVMRLLFPVNPRLMLVYGFTIFFGWLTALILGMTFKTLPFIVWNKIYIEKAGTGQTPNPKDLFSSNIFTIMLFCYLWGFLSFTFGILLAHSVVLKMGSALLFFCAFLYNANVFKVLIHKKKGV